MEDMTGMFARAGEAFEHPIDSWGTSSVIDSYALNVFMLWLSTIPLVHGILQA